MPVPPVPVPPAPVSGEREPYLEKVDPRLASLMRFEPADLLALVERDRLALSTLVLRRDALRQALAPPEPAWEPSGGLVPDAAVVTSSGSGAPVGAGGPAEPGDRLSGFIARARAAMAARRGGATEHVVASAAFSNQGQPLVAPAIVATHPLTLAPYTTGLRIAADGQALLRVLVQGDITDDSLGGPEVVKARAGRVTVCELPATRLRALALDASVERIELVRPVHAALTQVQAEIGGPAARSGQATGLPTGKGVIVGVVDFGLDLHHSDLRHPDGTSRVLGLWDQAVAEGVRGRQPPDLGFGWEWSKADIDEELTGEAPPYAVVSHRWDLQGGVDPKQGGVAGDLWMRHGTHVACVAVGNGSSGHPAVPGIAPDAELLFVSLDPELRLADAEDLWGVAGIDRVIEGVKWIMARADALQRERGHDIPVVINLSLADYTGPHDGQSNHQAFLDALQDLPGRVVVVAAGNGNEAGGHVARQMHPRTTLRPRAEHGATLTLEVGEGAVADDAFELWIDGTEDVGLRLTVPGGDVEFTLPEGVAIQDLVLTAGERRVRLLGARVKRPDKDLQGIRVDMLVEEGGLPVGEWTVALVGGGSLVRDVHGWLEWSNAGHRRWGNPTEDQVTVSDLASHDALLVVGSTGKKLGAPVAAPAQHSGRGPTRDGRQKPDIAAPGSNVRMAEAHGRVDRSKARGQEYLQATGSGTSLATAVVSGACAVLMECRGSTRADGQPRPAMLSTAELRDILRRSATQDVGARNGHRAEFVDGLNPAVGAGVLDLKAACLGRTGDADLWIAAFPGDQGREPRAAPAFWLSPDIRVKALGAPRGSTPAGAAVQVTVRNRGEQDAHGVHVALGWGPPVTWLPVDTEWLSAGTGSDGLGALGRLGADALGRWGAGALGRRGQDPSWRADGVHTAGSETALAAVGTVPAGGAAQAAFQWAAPLEGPVATEVAWIAMVRGSGDPEAGPFGREGGPASAALLRSRNEVAVRCLVERGPGPDGAAEVTFYVHGTALRDGLRLTTEAGARVLDLSLPSAALPVYAGVFAEDVLYRTPFGRQESPGPQGLSYESRLLAAFDGQRMPAPELAFGARGFGRATLVEDPVFGARVLLDAKEGELVLPELRLAEGALLPVTLRFSGPPGATVHVAHHSGARPIGGVSARLAGGGAAD